MYELVNVFKIFLPQLLLYPNPRDPLNGEAARLLQSNENDYNKKVKDYVQKYAKDISLNDDSNLKKSSADINNKLIEKDQNQKQDNQAQKNGDKAIAANLSETSVHLGNHSSDDDNDDIMSAIDFSDDNNSNKISECEKKKDQRTSAIQLGKRTMDEREDKDS